MSILRRYFRWSVVLAIVLIARVVGADAPASKWSVHVWQRNDGLSSNNISGVAQSSDGYLWVATDNTLARFDGTRFVECSPPAVCGGTTTNVSGMIRSHAGGIIVAMHGGPVGRFAVGAAPEIFSKGLPETNVTSMREDADRAIWINYHGGHIWRIGDGQAKEITTADGLPTEGVDCFFEEDAKGQLWFAQSDVVGQVRGGRFVPFAKMPSTNTRITAAHGGGVWCTSDGQLFHVDESGKAELRG